MRLTGELHVACGVGVGKTGGRAPGKYGAGLERELVVRNVCRLEAHRSLDIGHRCGQILVRQRVDQIEIEILDAGAPQLADRALRVRDRMYPAEPPQRLIGKALGAERDAIDTRGSVTTEAAVLDRARIGFESDLGIGGEAELRIQRIEQARESVRRK